MKRVQYFVVAMALLVSVNVYSFNVKIGVLAPEGTTWSKNLKKIASEVKSATNGEINFKFYFGGSQGDEVDVLRKIRIGQLHGGIFTGKTLGDISGDLRIMEVPFTFNENREKAYKILKGMAPYFNSKLEKEGFQNLGFIEIGLVFFISQKKAESLDGLNGIKIWLWEGDELATTMMQTMGFVSVPLPLPDVLSSLSTGIVEATYAPPTGIVALQWNTKVKYLVDFPLAYSIGAFLIDSKVWKNVPVKHKKTVEQICEKYINVVNEVGISENKDALRAMKSLGVEFVKFPEKDIIKGKEIRKKVIEQLKGKLFSTKVIDLINKQL